MANPWEELGPEWVYLAPLSSKRNITVEFDLLSVNLRREGDQPMTKIDSLQALRSTPGPNPDDFDLRFEAYEGARPRYGVAIPDASSFRRLLSAIQYLGFPFPDPVNIQAHEVPPVLRFFARPKDNSAVSPIRSFVPYNQSVNTGRSLSRGRRTLAGAPYPEVNAPGPSHRTQSGSRHRNYPNVNVQENTPRHQAIPDPSHQAISIRHEDALPGGDTRAIREGVPSPEDISMNYGDTPPSVQDVSARLEGSLLNSPEQAEGTRTSFLPVPEEPLPELTFEERVQIPSALEYGLSRDSDDVHDAHVHNLYSDIAGISRNKRDPENPDDEYQPPYSSVSLFPQQRYVAGWMYSNSTRILHYVTDKVGIGKTFAAIECLIRTTMILSNEIAIEEERAKLSSIQQRPLHVHPDSKYPKNFRFPKNTTCRADTIRLYGVVCHCSTKSPTYKVMQSGDFNEGYMMVVVPLLINSQWVSEIKRFIRSSVRLPHNQKPFEIVNIHEGTNYGDNMKNFVYGKREHLGLGTIVVVPATAAVKSTWEELALGKPLKQQPSIIVWDEIHEQKSKQNLLVSLVKRLMRQAKYPVHVLALSGSPLTVGPTDFDIIESIATFDRFAGWHTQQVYDDYVRRLQQARANLDAAAKIVTQHNIIGRGMLGEFQGQARTDAHEAMMVYDQRLREYAIELPMLQRRDGSRFLGYFIPKKPSAFEKAEIINCDARMNNLQRAVANKYKEYLRVRYRHKVKYWSRKPKETRGPRPKMKEILFSLESKIKVPDSSQITVSLIGFAPGLATQVLKRTEDQFRAPEANAIFKNSTISTQRQKARQSRYWEAAKSAFEIHDPQTGEQYLHPKIEFICGLINTMLEDQEEHVKGGRTLGVFQKKMCICTPHSWQAYILTAFLMQYYPSRGIIFVGALNQGRERDELMAPFTRPTDVLSPEEGRANDPIVLISTYNIIGTGLNLIRCNYSVATSPLASVTQETQWFGRINRIGQYTSTHCYVLLDNGNPVDVTTFHRQQRRTALTVPADEIGTGLQYLLDGIDNEDDRPPEEEYDSGEGDSDAE